MGTAERVRLVQCLVVQPRSVGGCAPSLFLVFAKKGREAVYDGGMPVEKVVLLRRVVTQFIQLARTSRLEAAAALL